MTERKPASKLDPAEYLDSDGYPTAAAGHLIREWMIHYQSDLDELWAFVRALWFYPERFVPDTTVEGANWYVSTGGWSGNEDLIWALQRNYRFWSLCWVQSRRGGHFWLQVDGRIP